MEIHIVTESRAANEALWHRFMSDLPVGSFVISQNVEFGIKINTEGFTSEQNKAVFAE